MQRVVRATVITDASHCPNTKASGWAVWVKVDGQHPGIREKGILQRADTSTAAEVMAAAIGVWYAARAGAMEILVQSDCMAVIHLIEQQTKSEALLAIWQHLLDMPLMAGRVLKARHVKGHGPVIDARTYVNDWCDRAAYAEMEKARGRHRRTTDQGNRQGRGSGRAPQEGSHPPRGVCPRP